MSLFATAPAPSTSLLKLDPLKIEVELGGGLSQNELERWS